MKLIYTITLETKITPDELANYDAATIQQAAENQLSAYVAEDIDIYDLLDGSEYSLEITGIEGE